LKSLRDLEVEGAKEVKEVEEVSSVFGGARIGLDVTSSGTERAREI
jgi:hypothetical protein